MKVSEMGKQSQVLPEATAGQQKKGEESKLSNTLPMHPKARGTLPRRTHVEDRKPTIRELQRGEGITRPVSRALELVEDKPADAETVPLPPRRKYEKYLGHFAAKRFAARIDQLMEIKQRRVVREQKIEQSWAAEEPASGVFHKTDQAPMPNLLSSYRRAKLKHLRG